VTYFEYTAQDLANQRAAGIVETRQEIGEQILALLDDTARKLNGETATDPNAEKEYDRGYLMEDLLSRLANFAGNFVPDAETLFPSVMDGRRATPAYPLLIEEQAPERIEEITQEIVGGTVGKGKNPLSHAIRAAAMAQTWSGYPRHGFERGTIDQFVCGAQIRSIYNSTGSPVTCNYRHNHEIHNLNPEVQS
jgi:hypothetical protein